MKILRKYFRQLLQRRISKSPYYGIMVDETTDKSDSLQLIIYIKFLDIDENEQLFINIEYLDLVISDSGQAQDITVILIEDLF